MVTDRDSSKYQKNNGAMNEENQQTVDPYEGLTYEELKELAESWEADEYCSFNHDVQEP